jgi:hypothetical protein
LHGPHQLAQVPPWVPGFGISAALGAGFRYFGYFQLTREALEHCRRMFSVFRRVPDPETE